MLTIRATEPGRDEPGLAAVDEQAARVGAWPSDGAVDAEKRFHDHSAAQLQAQHTMPPSGDCDENWRRAINFT